MWCAKLPQCCSVSPCEPSAQARGQRQLQPQLCAGLPVVQQPSWQGSGAGACPGRACPGTPGLRNNPAAKEQGELRAAAASPAVQGPVPSRAPVSGQFAAGTSAEQSPKAFRSPSWQPSRTLGRSTPARFAVRTSGKRTPARRGAARKGRPLPERKRPHIPACPGPAGRGREQHAGSRSLPRLGPAPLAAPCLCIARPPLLLPSVKLRLRRAPGLRAPRGRWSPSVLGGVEPVPGRSGKQPWLPALCRCQRRQAGRGLAGGAGMGAPAAGAGCGTRRPECSFGRRALAVLAPASSG